MKKYALLLVAPLLVLFSTCKKENAPPEETALSGFLADSTSQFARGNYNRLELGYRFYASRKGRITKIGTRMPESGSYPVTIWDYDTRNIVVQQTIQQSQPNALTLQAITPFAVMPNKKYVISVFYGTVPQAAYVIVSRDGSALLPFTKGSVTVVNSQFRYADASLFPNNADNVGIYGFPEVTFVAD